MAPEEIVVELDRAWRLEAGDVATLRIDPGEDMLDGAILPGGIHRLEDAEHRPAILRIEHVLRLAEQGDAFL